MIFRCPKCNAQNKKDAKFCNECGLSLIHEDVPTELKALTPGAILANRYEVITRIKSGGMGSVYKAKHVGLGKIYAVKELLNLSMNEQEQQEAIRRFKMEAKILSELNHANMPAVSDYFSIGGRYYLVMDFIDGKDLSGILEEKGTPGLPETDVVEWAIQICDVLNYLHNQEPSIIYRDIKPSNIMIRNTDRRAILIDFGIARTVQTEIDISQTKTAIGTAGYMSPEQYRGKPITQSDLYSLGATMYQLLTGNQPIPFTFPSLINERPDLSEEINAIVMTSLRLKPSERFKSALEMKQALMGTIKVALPVTEEPDKIDLLLLQLNVPDTFIRKFSVKALGEIKDEKAIKPLLKVLRKDKDAEIRQIALNSLRKFDLNQEIEKALKDVLIKDENSMVRALSVQAMATYLEPAFMDPLITAMFEDRAVDVRQSAIMALGKLKDPQALEALYEIFKTEEGLLREEAIVAIENIDPNYIKEWRDQEDEVKKTVQAKITGITIITISILLVAGLLLFNFATKAYKNQKISGLISQGLIYIKTQKHDKARETFQKVMEMDERNAMAFYGNGLTYLDENPDKAMDFLEKATTFDRNFGWPYFYLSSIYVRKSDYATALIKIEKAKELMPDNSDVYLAMGEVYILSDQIEKAEQVLLDCKDKFPEVANDDSWKRLMALINQGTASNNTGTPPPSQEGPLYNNAVNYYNQQNYSEAKKLLDEAIKINPANANVQYLLGKCYMKIETPDYDSAKSHFNLATQYGNTLAYSDLAEINFQQENYRETISVCEKGINVSAQKSTLYMLMGLSYYKLGQGSQALEPLEKYLELEPNGPNAAAITEIIKQIKSGAGAQNVVTY